MQMTTAASAIMTQEGSNKVSFGRARGDEGIRRTRGWCMLAGKSGCATQHRGA